MGKRLRPEGNDERTAEFIIETEGLGGGVSTTGGCIVTNARAARQLVWQASLVLQLSEWEELTDRDRRQDEILANLPGEEWRSLTGLSDGEEELTRVHMQAENDKLHPNRSRVRLTERVHASSGR